MAGVATLAELVHLAGLQLPDTIPSFMTENRPTVVRQFRGAMMSAHMFVYAVQTAAATPSLRRFRHQFRHFRLEKLLRHPVTPVSTPSLQSWVIIHQFQLQRLRKGPVESHLPRESGKLQALGKFLDPQPAPT